MPNSLVLQRACSASRALSARHREKYDTDDDKHTPQNAHVNLVLLRRQQSLGDRRSLPKPALKDVGLFEFVSKAAVG